MTDRRWVRQVVALAVLGCALFSAAAPAAERPDGFPANYLDAKDTLVVEPGKSVTRRIDIRLALSPDSPCPPLLAVGISGITIPPTSENPYFGWTKTAPTEPTPNPYIERLVSEIGSTGWEHTYRLSPDWVRNYRGDNVISLSNRLFARVSLQIKPGVEAGYVSAYPCFFKDGHKVARFVLKFLSTAARVEAND